NLIRLPMPDLAQGRKQPRGVHGSEIVEIIAIDALDPLAIPFGGARISYTDAHGGRVSCHVLERSMNRSLSGGSPYRIRKGTRPGQVNTRPGLTHLSAQACNPKWITWRPEQRRRPEQPERPPEQRHRHPRQEPLERRHRQPEQPQERRHRRPE